MTTEAYGFDFPSMKRRWEITIFRNEKADGIMQQSVSAHYENVRSKWTSGDVVSHEGMLCFITEDGKEVVASSVAFLARETTSAENMKLISEERDRMAEFLSLHVK